MNRVNVMELVRYLTTKDNEFQDIDYTQILTKVKEVTIAECTGGDFYIYIDRGADILGVAHLDTVMEPDIIWEYQTKTSKNRAVFGAGMDDRFGVYLLLHHLEKLGLKYDVLLTTGEESLGSTASAFRTDKQYNWIFQFDRTGTDVVMYDYETPDLRNMLTDEHFDVGIGSYTCICELEHLSAKAFNFGCGYYNNHSQSEYVDLVDAEYMIGLFYLFYLKHHTKAFPHVEGSGTRVYHFGRDYSDRIPGGWAPTFYPKEEGNADAFNEEEMFDYPTYDKTFNYLVDIEGMDSYEAHFYAFEEAKRAFRHKPSWEYDEEGEYDPLSDVCMICGDPLCAGLVTCEICDAQYHDDKLIIETGLCRRCWERYIKTDEEL